MSKHGLIETAKRQKGKTATLGVLFLLMSVVWGKALVGGDEDSKSKSKSKSSSSASAQAPSMKSSSTSRSSKASVKKVGSPATGRAIRDFATAVGRLDAWAVPLNIERKGPITDEYVASVRAAALAEDEARSERFARARAAGQRAAEADINGELLAMPEQFVRNDEDANAAAPEPVEIRAPAAPLIVAEDIDIDLTLTGTALLGKQRYALFGDRRVQEGGQIGRYQVHAVRSREVDVVIDGKLTVIRIAPPELD